MFGPNGWALFGDASTFHHRSPEFRGLYRKTRELFKERFSIPDDFDVVFVTGSGTLANEMVISSMGGFWDCMYNDAEFGHRLQALAEEHQGNFDRKIC